MCNCMAVEEGISTSEGHYVRCVTVWLGKRGYQPVKVTRCVIVWKGKGGYQPVKDTL